jgi:RNA polymerase sigma-70 factor (ECF subfamily)
MVIGADKAELELVGRMLSGEEAAFGEFFESYFPGLYRFALSRLGRDEDAAEEVTQETLCNVIRKLDTFRGEAALFSWMCTFCRHEISAWHRRRGREAREADLAEDLPEIRGSLDSLAMAALEPADELRRREVARLVRAILDRLPPRHGNALEWKYIDGLTVAEIAERLDVGLKATESLLTRARKSFRDGMQSACGGMNDLGALGPRR